MADTDVRVLYWAVPPLAREQIAAGINAIPGVTLDIVADRDQVLSTVAEYDGVILGDKPPTEASDFIAAIDHPTSRVSHLHFISAGREGFLAAGLPGRFTVSGPDGASAPAVAEHAVSLLLALVRRLPQSVRNTDQAVWDRTPFMGTVGSVEGRTAVIVGLGHVGRQTAQRLRAFGVHTIGVTRTPTADDAVDEITTSDNLLAVLGRADVLVLTLALTNESRGLIGAAELAALPAGAVVINVARGPVMDHTALLSALTSGALGGAGLDVTDPEPLPNGDPLWSAPNVLISPHYGGASPHTMARTADSAVAMVKRLVQARGSR